MRFACPHCQQSLECDDDMSGTEIECPSCANAITVPADATPHQPPPLPSDPDAYLALVPDASVMAGGDRSGRNWGVLLFTHSEMLFVTKSRFRSIGIFGAVGAPMLGLAIGLVELVTEKIRGALRDKKLSELPPPATFKQYPDTISIPYAAIHTLSLRPYLFMPADLELMIGEEACVYLNVPKPLRKHYRSLTNSRGERNEAYAHDLARVLGKCSNVTPTVHPFDMKEALKPIGFFLLLLLGFALLLLFIRMLD